MPHLLIRGVAPEQVRAVSAKLAEELAEICACPPDHFAMECLATTAAFGGYPFVEVAWFDRGREAQDRFARAVDRHLREALGLPELEIAFRTYRRRDYYANGESLGAAENGEESPERERDEADLGEAEALREANRKLADELRKARKALAQAAGGAMSTKLREALRE